MDDSLNARFERLAAGAARHIAAGPDAWATLALATARTVVDSADRWADAAVVMKQGGAAARGEEMATGPLGTLRLLLITARALSDIDRTGVPRLPSAPRLVHGGGGGVGGLVAIDVLPARGLHDGLVYRGQRATVRCANPGGIEPFMRSWQRECRERPTAGGVAAVLGAGNVTGLSVADAISQIFEHGRAAFVKLHPLHEPLLPVLRKALAPLIEADLVAFALGGADIAREAVAAAAVTHVHLTGGRAAFDAIAATVHKPLTCELGNVTPWIVVPGRYTPAQLQFQADTIAASIVNNTSFNCIATKLVVTCRGWEQRDAFLTCIARRLAAQVARPAWYPGSQGLWREVTGREPPADGTLPWVFRTHLDPRSDAAWLGREWFVPVAGEVAIDAADTEAFCIRATALVHDLPGSLAANVTAPESLSTRDAERVELLLEHLPYGVVARNCWAALAYAMGCVPWGGYPGGTIAEPESGIGFVHDPFFLPLVHNSIIRGPLASRITPPWFPWHTGAAALAGGLVDAYGAIARGKSGVWPMLRMLPAVLSG